MAWTSAYSILGHPVVDSAESAESAETAETAETAENCYCYENTIYTTHSFVVLQYLHQHWALNGKTKCYLLGFQSQRNDTWFVSKE